MASLVVAAGGGGDAITAAAVGPLLDAGSTPVVMTYAWERLMIDPLPGPRTPTDFTGLAELADGVREIRPDTHPVLPAGSALPRLAAELPLRLLLLDPTGGAVGMSEQITAAAAHFDLDTVVILDVGGDILTDGTDAGLRSPLADQLALAACLNTPLPARVVVTGLGLDGELTSTTLTHRLATGKATRIGAITPDLAATVAHVFDWHPSEASGLLMAAATGRRGVVEVRDAGDQIQLTETTTDVYAMTAHGASHVTPAAHLQMTTSLDEAAARIRQLTGKNELAYETRKAQRLRLRTPHDRTPSLDDLHDIDECARAAHQRGTDYISTRRLAELQAIHTLTGYGQMIRFLRAARPDVTFTSVYQTRCPTPNRPPSRGTFSTKPDRQGSAAESC